MNDITKAFGISVIMDALIKGCPKLRTVVYNHWDIDADMVEDMFQAAGRDNVNVITDDEWEGRCNKERGSTRMWKV